jgi:hypothetical protein
MKKAPKKWVSASSIPAALQIAGDCPCGEKSVTRINAKMNGRGPFIYQILCACCGRILVTEDGEIKARIPKTL